MLEQSLKELVVIPETENSGGTRVEAQKEPSVSK